MRAEVGARLVLDRPDMGAMSRKEYRPEGSKVRLLRPDLEEIRQHLEKENKRLQKENKRLRDVIENAHTGIEEGWIDWTGKMLEEEIRGWKGGGE